MALELSQNLLDAIDALKDAGDALGRDRGAVAVLPHQGLGGMGELG
jgi:hypothetical protein